jgi:hypothetical protein
MAEAGGKPDVSEAAVFGRMDLFCKRCRKLAELFTTIQQFTLLAQVPRLSFIIPETHSLAWLSRVAGCSHLAWLAASLLLDRIVYSGMVLQQTHLDHACLSCLKAV